VKGKARGRSCGFVRFGFCGGRRKGEGSVLDLSCVIYSEYAPGETSQVIVSLSLL